MSRLDSVGLAKQAAMGTVQTTMEYFLPVESADPGISQENLEREETTGNRFPTDLEKGSRFWEPTMSGACRVASLPRLLSAFMGAPTTTTPDGAGAPAARNHNFNPAAGGGATLVPHSILLNRTDPSPAITDLLWDAIGNTLSLSVEPNDFLGFDAGYVAREIDEARPEPTVTPDLTRRFPFHEAKAYISVNGGAEAEMKVGGFALNDYSNNVDTDQVVLGSRSLFKVEGGNIGAGVSFSPKETLSTHYRRAIAATPDNVKVRLEALGPIIGAAVRYKVEVIVHRLHYEDAPALISAGDTLDEVEVSARAAYDQASSKFIEVNVVNIVASY